MSKIKPDKAVEILNLNIREAGKQMPPDTLTALVMATSALSRIQTMRSYNIPQAIYPLPGEYLIPDISPSADKKQKLRESPLGREPRH